MELRKLYNHHLKVCRAGSKQQFVLVMHIVRTTLKAAPIKQLPLFYSVLLPIHFHYTLNLTEQEATLQ